MDRLFKCCPFCESKDIKEEILDYESYMYGTTERTYGECNICEKVWIVEI